MSRAIPKPLRNQVAQRAGHRCEYCRLHEDDLFLAFEVDHIISQKHGGGDELENLAYACPHCNHRKGSDLTTFLENFGDLVRLFHPRNDAWTEHFQPVGGEILPKTRIGRATIKVLQVNQPELLRLRKLLADLNRWP